MPDLLGCAALAETKREVLKIIREGIALHVEALREAGSRCRLRSRRERWSGFARHENAMHTDASCSSRPSRLRQRPRGLRHAGDC